MRAAGVDQMFKLLFFVCLVVFIGCGHESAATQQIRSAAAVDLSCDESVIEIVEDAPMEKRVSGCGRTLTYMYKCNPTPGGGQDCRWKAVPDRGND
jgi:hypothetical protein